jgi:hypothetical protein
MSETMRLKGTVTFSFDYEVEPEWYPKSVSTPEEMVHNDIYVDPFMWVNEAITEGPNIVIDESVVTSEEPS